MNEQTFGGTIASPSSLLARVARADVLARADELHSAAQTLAAERPRLEPGAYRLGDIPAPPASYDAAAARVRTLGRRICDRGGVALMSQVYDAAVDRHDWRGVRGVSSQWDGIG